MKEIRYGEKVFQVANDCRVVVVDGGDFPRRQFNGNSYFEDGKKYTVVEWLYRSTALARAIVQAA